MNLELFAAAVLISAGFSIAVYFAVARKARHTGSAADLTEIESRVADLITELNHVANSHVHSVEDRRDELKRVIELANQSIRKLGSLLSDLAIVEKRLRSSEPAVGDGASGEEAGEMAAYMEPKGPEARPVAEGHSIARSVAHPDRGRRVRARRELYAEIREMASGGLGPHEIAGRLMVPVKEVEMVMRRSQ